MLLCDLEVVFLVLMRVRTSEVRDLQAVVSHQGLVIMGGNDAVATAMAQHWKAERETKPCNVLLHFSLVRLSIMKLRRPRRPTRLLDLAKPSKILQNYHVYKRRQILSRWRSSARLRCPGS